MSLLQWGDVPTWGLFAGAVVTAIFAIRAFFKQSEEVTILKGQALDQQELTKQQGELLKVQSAHLDIQRQRLEEQRSAPRIAAWEAAVRELSLYLGHELRVFWTASDHFPADKDSDPPEYDALFETRNAFRRLYMHLLGILGVLPVEVAKKVLPVTMRLVDAETELNALALAMIEAETTGCAEGRTTWQWKDAQRAHDASDDPARSQPWSEVASGQKFRAAQEEWERLASDVEDHLHGTAPVPLSSDSSPAD